MIIFGTKSVLLESVELEDATCPSCGEQDTMLLSVFRKHAHIFWIPFFPIGKQSVAECEHCKYVMKESEMSQELKQESQILKKELKGPMWQFSGLALVGAIIVWSSIISSQNEKENLEYIANPLVGDVYEYKIEEESYSTLKVVQVTIDSVFVTPNEYETNKMSGIRDIEKKKNYSEFTFSIARSRIEKMLSEGEIYDVNRRKYNINRKTR